MKFFGICLVNVGAGSPDNFKLVLVSCYSHCNYVESLYRIVKARTPALGCICLPTIVEWTWLQTLTGVIIVVDL